MISRDTCEFRVNKEVLPRESLALHGRARVKPATRSIAQSAFLTSSPRLASPRPVLGLTHDNIHHPLLITVLHERILCLESCVDGTWPV